MENKKNWKVMLLNIDVVIASAAMVLLVALTFSGVIARYVVGRPFGWIEEVQAALIVWVIFGAAGAAYRTANHAAIEIFYEMFPKMVQKILNVFILLVSIGTLLFLAKTSIDYINMFAATGRKTAVLHLSYQLIYCLTPISCIWQLYNFVIVNFFGYSEKEVIGSQKKNSRRRKRKKESSYCYCSNCPSGSAVFKSSGIYFGSRRFGNLFHWKPECEFHGICTAGTGRITGTVPFGNSVLRYGRCIYELYRRYEKNHGVL